MTAQRPSATRDDGIEYLAMRPCKVRLLLFLKPVARFTYDVGHLEGGPAHRFIRLLECFTSSGRDTSRFEPTGNGLQVTWTRSNGGRGRQATAAPMPIKRRSLHLDDKSLGWIGNARWHTDGAGMMGRGHFRYSDLKEAAGRRTLM